MTRFTPVSSPACSRNSLYASDVRIQFGRGILGLAVVLTKRGIGENAMADFDQSGNFRQRLEAFWPYYLGEHSRRVTRQWHFAGSALGLLCLALFVVTLRWWLIPAGLVAGYGCAWIGHFFFEKNRPATFKYPLLSFISDWRMFYAMLSGTLTRDLERFGIQEPPNTRT